MQGRAKLDGHKQRFCLARVPALTSSSHAVGASLKLECRPAAAASRQSLTWSCPIALTSSRRACRGTLHWGEAAAVTPTSMARMARFHMLHQGSNRVSGQSTVDANACSSEHPLCRGYNLPLDAKRMIASPRVPRGPQPDSVILQDRRSCLKGHAQQGCLAGGLTPARLLWWCHGPGGL